MKHLFLSDVHLGAFPAHINQRIEQELISLLDFCYEQTIHIHILGDLFDYWMEFGDIIPELGKEVLKKFKWYNAHVHPITYITGNHDNWTESYFDKLGFDVQQDYKIVREEENSIFLHHGDGISDPGFDLPRPLFHRVLRHPLFIKLYKRIFTPDVGIDIMRQFSAISRDNPSDEPERLNRWSASLLHKSDYNLIISGHDHHPRVETFPFGTYINLGTFSRDKTVAYYTNGACNLVSWNAESKTLTPFNPEHKI